MQPAALKVYVLVFVVALAARSAWGLYRYGSGVEDGQFEFPDERQYWSMGKSLHGGAGLVDEFGFRATRMPLYPSFLSVFSTLERGTLIAKAIQWAVGAALAVLTSAIAGLVWNGRAALVAGLLVAFDPFFIVFSSLLLTETFFVVAATGVYLCALPMISRPTRRIPFGRWLVLGGAASVSIYIREIGLGLVVALLMVVVCRRRFDRRALAGAFAATVVIFVSLLPWAMRNRSVTGSWCWLTNRAGVSLYDGVRPGADGSSNLGDVQQADEVRGLSETEWNRHFLSAGRRAIMDDPLRILGLAPVKWGRTWNPLPNLHSYRSRGIQVVSACWMIPVLLSACLGIIMLVRRRGKTGLWLALYLMVPALYVTAVHSLFVGSIRYRLPAMPMIEVLAAVAVVGILQRIGGLRSSPRSISSKE